MITHHYFCCSYIHRDSDDEDLEWLESFQFISVEMNRDLIQSKRNKNILLLGMAYSSQSIKPSRGQQYRDQLRIESLIKNGFNVYTLDNKHSSTINDKNKHCCSDFSGTRRMLKDMHLHWPKVQFDHIILDYFFSPVYYYLFIFA